MPDRYDVSGSVEGKYQPGSNDRVLLNRLNIADPDAMDDVELHLLDAMQTTLFNEVEVTQAITTADLCNWHGRWLGSVYDWAGRFRSVNMQKDGFPPLLDFQWMADHKEEYFAAIQHGHAGNYEPISRVFSLVLQASLTAK